jgi:eukaryotic-like serine/threonine-protein kinase
VAKGENELEGALPGTTLGRYVLRYEIARGGMGTVFLAQLPGPSGFEKWAAIKWIHPHLSKDARFISMFLDEARLAAQVQHVNVCQVIDLVAESGRCWLVMEYLHGESFAAVIGRAVRREGNLPVPIAVRIVIDAARGLHAAHVAVAKDGSPLGIVHRDVSPHNIQVLYDGTSKLLDFGVAKARGRVSGSEPGELKGKIPYMSPEQLRRTELDRRADVWALGVVLWEALTGKFLFRAASEAITMRRILEAEIEPPSVFRSIGTIDPTLDRIVRGALERDLGKRTSSAGELADALEAYLHGLGAPTGASHVAAWMDASFTDERKSREQLLREPASGEIITTRLAAEDEEEDTSRSLVSLEPPPPIAAVLGQPREPPPPESADLRPDLRIEPLAEVPPEPQRTRALPAFVLGMLLVASAAYVIRTTRTHEPQPFVPSPPIPTAPAPMPEETPARTAPRARVAHEAPEAEASGRRPLHVPEGTVHVVARPTAEIYLGDRLLGITPMHVPLPVGAHVLELRWATVRRDYPVRVRDGETTVVSARMEEEE